MLAAGGVLLAATGGLLAIPLLRRENATEPAWGTVPAPEPSPAAGGLGLDGWLLVDGAGVVTVTVWRYEMGQGSRTTMAQVVAEELDVDWASVRVRHALDDDVEMAKQTGGSETMRSSWTLLRDAGALARAALLEAAAARHDVPVAKCRTEAGQVLLPSGESVGYGELVADAAELDLTALSPVPKSGKDYRLVGHRPPRLDAQDVVTGRAVFASDVRRPGMAFAVLARPPHTGATLAGADEKAAKSVDGALAVHRVDAGVAVLATSTWAAFRGREALQAKWQAAEAGKLDSAAISESLLAAAKEESADFEPTVTARYEFPFLAHATMEPMTTTVEFADGKAQVWAPSQDITQVRSAVGEVLGLDLSAVQVHGTMMGGGFGRRLEWDVAVEAAQIAKVAGRPVQLVWSRDDDLRHDFYRPASVHALAARLDDAGRVLDLSHRVAAVEGLPGSVGVSEDAAAFALGESPYSFGVASSVAMVNHPVRTGPWRGVFMSQTGPALETFVDELAGAAGVDPLEFRLRNITNPRMRAVLRRLRASSGWDDLAANRRGMGCVASFGSFCAVAVEVAPGPILQKITVVADCGLVVHPSVVEGQLQGGIVDAISTVLWAAITFRDGAAQQASFADYRWARCADVPPIEVVLLPSTEDPAGVGELAYPAAAPAIMNAFAAASGRRHRSLPLQVGG